MMQAYVNELQKPWRPCGEEADASLMATRRLEIPGWAWPFDGAGEGGARGTRTPDPLLAKEVTATGGPAAAQLESDAGCSVNDRESPSRA
jgi:hypothetical protein